MRRKEAAVVAVAVALAAVAAVFGHHDVSIQSMEQIERDGKARLVFITHVAKEADVQATIAELTSL
ncbi:MAG: ACT domain-containing protein, partial [Nitrososphaerota archaeon]|nr:ACT domain-containing protein [Nitrososphaerota archaeon]